MELEFNPNETRRRANVAQAFNFGGKDFTQNETVFSSFKHWMLGANAYKRLSLAESTQLNIGLGIYGHLFETQIASETKKDKYASQQHWRLMPSVTAKLTFAMTNKLSAISKLQYQAWAGDDYLQVEVGLNYQLNSEWDMGVKYQHSKTTLANEYFNTKYDADSISLTFANHF